MTITNDVTRTADPTPSSELLLAGDALDVLFRDARSARAWSHESVTDELVEAVHDVVRLAPTALNSSPLRMLLVRSPQARAQLAAHMNEGNRQRVIEAPLSIVLAADHDFHEHLDALMPHQPGARDRLAGNPEARARMARDNSWLQAGYLLLGLRSAGLSVGPMSGMDAAAIDADLLAGTSWRSIMVLNVGYPSAEPHPYPRVPRLATAQTTAVV